MTTPIQRHLFGALLLAISLLLFTSCSAGPTEESAIGAVKDLEGGSFMASGSVDRFGVEAAEVEGECAIVQIIELPSLYETTIFLRWVDGSWEGTSIVTGHGSDINGSAANCFRD